MGTKDYSLGDYAKKEGQKGSWKVHELDRLKSTLLQQ